MKLCSVKELILINISLFPLFLLHSSCQSIHRITPSQPLRDGGVLLSDGGTFALGFFTPNNKSANRYVGIWYTFSSQTVVWVANREKPLNDTSGVLLIDAHGNLVLNHMNLNQNPIWSSNVSITSPTDTFTQLHETGNLVLIENGGSQKVLWQSFDFPGNTRLSPMKLGVDRKTGFKWFLTSWKSPEDPGLGNASHLIDPTGYPQSFVYTNGAPFWRIGPWTGHAWSGIPEMIPDIIFKDTFVNNATEVSITNIPITEEYSSAFHRMVLNNTGHVIRTIWNVNEHRWDVFWQSPKEKCDIYGQCGSNSKCNPNGIDIVCACLIGFEPKIPQEWNRRNWSGGCVRKKNVSTCQSGVGFVKEAHVKLPDTSKARVDTSGSMNLKGCEEKCLKDCSCVAYTSANVVTQSGCLTWHADMEDIRTFINGGQDLYVRVDAEELAKYESKHHGSLGKKGRVILIISICLMTFLMISLVYWFVKSKKQAKTMDNNHLLDGENNSHLPLFNLSDIFEATDSFSNANKLGQGGFGSVYKGLLNDGMAIAVKRLSKYSGQGIEEFRNEVALIAKVQHRNLVRILGCCIQEEEKMLIYEYLPNKSLDSFIFDQEKKLQLDWKKRFDIICGVARGILYLHQDSRLRIIHRDLKASNILLDSILNPKIADFGMARIFDGDQIEANTNRVVGTYGYMSPEYAMKGLYSVKSDVYSFGVLLLEIVTSKKNRGYYNDITCTLAGHIWDLWRDNRAMEIVDPTLIGEACPEHEVLKCIQIGLLCVQEYATNRPTMPEVVSMLDNELALPHPEQPAFIFKETTCDHSKPYFGEEVNSVNGMSTTVIEAR